MSRATCTEFEKFLVFGQIEVAKKRCVGYRHLRKMQSTLHLIAMSPILKCVQVLDKCYLLFNRIPKHGAPALSNRPVLMSISVGHKITNERWDAQPILSV
jgi:hypothetical protein